MLGSKGRAGQGRLLGGDSLPGGEIPVSDPVWCVHHWTTSGYAARGPQAPGLDTCISPQLRAHVGANSSLLPLRLRADDAHVALATASVPTGFQELKCNPDTSKVSLRLS